MFNLVNSNFNKTYNPSGKQNALSDIKRLLTSRHTEAQNKACGYLVEVISRYNKISKERSRMVEYLLDNDITVFLCEATSNLDYSLFRSILSCLRLLWRERRFFSEEHASHSMAAVLRALAHYTGTGSYAAVELCLHFLCDLLDGISSFESISPLSHQSAYSTEQLLASLNALASHLNTNPRAVLSSALVLHALVSYQPDSLAIRGATAVALVEVTQKWFGLIMGVMNHSVLMGDNEVSGMSYVVVCQLGVDVLRLTKTLLRNENKIDFVQAILTDDNEINLIKDSTFEMLNSIRNIISELVVFTKENQSQITTEEYSVFLKFLLMFFQENASRDVMFDFCDVLFSKNYLTMLPHAQIIRNDTSVRKLSTLILGEMLKVLADKYLSVDENRGDKDTCARDIQMGLVELQCGIEKPQSVGSQLQKGQPYSLLIYIYFYCQSSEKIILAVFSLQILQPYIIQMTHALLFHISPEEATAQLLPYLVEHILRLPSAFKPPSYIIKALWLVFAMSAISNESLQSLDERVYLEKATDRLVSMLHPDPSVYYTHNPAILLWCFTSQRIPNYVRIHVLSQWLQTEDSLPCDLTTDPSVWELLLNILIQNRYKAAVLNCKEALQQCLEDGTEEETQRFAGLVWGMLPNVLSKTLIDYDSEIDTSICPLLELATTLVPPEVDQTVCLKIAVLITTIFSKNLVHSNESLESRFYFEFVCLKLSLYLLDLANNQNDNRVLLTFTNRAGFLSLALSASNSADDRVACAALQLLSYVVHYFTKNKYQPKSVLQVETHSIIKSLRRDSSSERGACLLQLVYTVLNSGAHTPLALALELDTLSATQQCNALRALMFRIQLMLCCRESETQSLAGWKTLSSIFKYAIVSKNDTKLVATLTSQPWTHTLIHFQLTQNVTQEFLTFIQNWLTLLKITMKKQEKKRHLNKESLIAKTMFSLKKNLVIEGDDNKKEVKQKILGTVKEIMGEFAINDR